MSAEEAKVLRERKFCNCHLIKWTYVIVLHEITLFLTLEREQTIPHVEQVVVLGAVGSVVSGERERDCRQSVAAEYHLIKVRA